MSNLEQTLSIIKPDAVERNLDSEINTLFMMTHERYSHISSSLIKEVASLGGEIKEYVPKNVLEIIKGKLNESYKKF